jgi:thioesterase domain-containing protein/acyl carrier protein
MTVDPKRKVRAIYPLGAFQRALLFTHQANSTADPGMIQSRYRIAGELDVTRFTQAWRTVAARHEVLSASVHWKTVSKPVWVVHHDVSPPVELLNWQEEAKATAEDRMAEFLRKDLERGIDLQRPFAGRLTLIRRSATDWQLVWSSHHILLDGWSSGLVMREVMNAYEAARGGNNPLPPTGFRFRDYLNWEKGQDRKAIQTFWTERLSTLGHPTTVNNTDGPQRQISRSIAEADSLSLDRLCKQHGLTLNTVLQGLWAIVLSRYTETEPVCFGITVSGRPAEVAGMETAVGMFARVLPRIIDLDTGDGYFSEIQRMGAREIAHMAVSPQELADWMPGPTERLPFNTLFTVQNYPWTEFSGGGVRITDQQGDLTSNYPLTCIVVPREDWVVYLRHKPGISEAQADWLLDALVQLIHSLGQSPRPDSGLFRESLGPPPESERITGPPYAAPTNPTQLRLVGIWERLLPVEHVGIDDDFFASGGNSLAAVQMFARFEAQSGKNIEPAKLMAHPTVRQLAAFIDGTDDTLRWNNLVPQRVSGQLPPAFCFHAGLGQVFMYQPLTRHLHADRPVYSLQPNGLNGVDRPHETIEEMAEHYLREMDRLGSTEPMILISFCYSAPICLEIGRMLVAAGRPAPILVAIDMAPSPGRRHRLRSARGSHPPGSLRWYLGQLRRRRYRLVTDELASRFFPDSALTAGQRLRIRASRLKYSLIKAFVRYAWPHYGHPVLLIRSSDYASRYNQQSCIDNWKDLTAGQLTVRDVAAGHRDILHEPSAARVAAIVEAYIQTQQSE